MVTVDTLLSYSVAQFFHLQNGDNCESAPQELLGT